MRVAHHHLTHLDCARCCKLHEVLIRGVADCCPRFSSRRLRIRRWPRGLGSCSSESHRCAQVATPVRIFAREPGTSIATDRSSRDSTSLRGFSTSIRTEYYPLSRSFCAILMIECRDDGLITKRHAGVCVCVSSDRSDKSEDRGEERPRRKQCAWMLLSNVIRARKYQQIGNVKILIYVPELR